MPLSRPDTIPKVINLIWELNPKSILDVGCGWGAMGVLFRQTCDIRWGRMRQWETIIHGIERFSGYQNQLWTNIYNKVFLGDAIEMMGQTELEYDVVFLGDVLEHFEEAKAKELLDLAIKKASRYVIITTPASFADNKEEAKRFANESEEHRCLIKDSIMPEGATEIEQYGNQKVFIINIEKYGEQQKN